MSSHRKYSRRMSQGKRRKYSRKLKGGVNTLLVSRKTKSRKNKNSRIQKKRTLGGSGFTTSEETSPLAYIDSVEKNY